MTEDNRIPEIRAALAVYDSVASMPADYLADTIRAILDSAPPAPRVFFPGDTVPAGIWVLSGRLGFHRVPWDWTITETYVEAHPMTREEWQAAVDRASEERAIPEPTEGQNP
ncbi:hypothetical protein [Amycolatopsis sp. NPDC049159]|uniref:hypothetical protein n=1 Tax=Amycolatopsis sp. NPDC049159 TaxID=3157210 RepID=UPI00340602BD